MNIKNESGITLIALVTTIIVMLILGTIIISASVGDNGLIKQAEEGVIKASIREVEEALNAHILLKEKDKIKNGDFSKVKLNELKEEGILQEAIKAPVYLNDEYKVLAYKVKELDELGIKGDYGKGSGKNDAFYVIAYLGYDDIYSIAYIDSDGNEVNFTNPYDYNNNRKVDDEDLDQIVSRVGSIISNNKDKIYDLNGDGIIQLEDIGLFSNWVNIGGIPEWII